jgi:hypothetical protein
MERLLHADPHLAGLRGDERFDAPDEVAG